jgi:hypothetical protein
MAWMPLVNAAARGGEKAFTPSKMLRILKVSEEGASSV